MVSHYYTTVLVATILGTVTTKVLALVTLKESCQPSN